MYLPNGPMELSEWEALENMTYDAGQNEQGIPQQSEPVLQREHVPVTEEDLDPYVPPNEEAASKLQHFLVFLEERDTTIPSKLEDSNDVSFMSPTPLQCSDKPPPPPPINYGHSVSYLPPIGSHDQAKSCPPTHDNVTIPPHLMTSSNPTLSISLTKQTAPFSLCPPSATTTSY